MTKTLYLEKRGCNFWHDDNINAVSDVGNYRVCTPDECIKGKDGNTYFLEFTQYDKYTRINIKYLCLLILKALTVIFAVVGAFLLLGAVGSHELFRIGVTDFLILLLRAVLLFGIAYGINRFTRRFYRE